MIRRRSCLDLPYARLVRDENGLGIKPLGSREIIYLAREPDDHLAVEHEQLVHECKAVPERDFLVAPPRLHDLVPTRKLLRSGLEKGFDFLCKITSRISPNPPRRGWCNDHGGFTGSQCPFCGAPSAGLPLSQTSDPASDPKKGA